MSAFDYRIAAGWNVSLGSLINIEAITPSGDRPFKAPKVYGTFNPGIYKVRLDGTVYVAGYPSQLWLFDALTRKQFEYLRTTYCSGGWSGKVTIYTRLATASYTRQNAIMILPRPSDSDGQFFAFRRYGVQMTRLVASS